MRRGGDRDPGESAADPLPAGRGRPCGGGGGAAWTRPGLGWWWEVEGRPRSASALVEGGNRAGLRRGSTNTKWKLCTGGWGARAAAQVRRGGRARRGRAARSRPAGGGGGRVCRGVARGGAAGLGGVAEPRLRARQVGARPGLSGAPSPPGPPPALLGGLRQRTGGVGKERKRRGLEGVRGSLTTYPGAVGPHVPPPSRWGRCSLSSSAAAPRSHSRHRHPSWSRNRSPSRSRSWSRRLCRRRHCSRRSRASSSRAPPLAPAPAPLPLPCASPAPPLPSCTLAHTAAEPSRPGEAITQPRVCTDWNSQY